MIDLDKAKDLAANPIHCQETDEVFRDAIAEIERLRDIIDKPPEEDDWLKDRDFIAEQQPGIVAMAYKWLCAYRKAQNSNLVRAKEIERQAARIKELEGWLKEEKAQNLLNFQRHDEGESRSWDDLTEKERHSRIQFAGTCLEAEGKIGGGDKE